HECRERPPPQDCNLRTHAHDHEETRTDPGDDRVGSRLPAGRKPVAAASEAGPRTVGAPSAPGTRLTRSQRTSDMIHRRLPDCPTLDSGLRMRLLVIEDNRNLVANLFAYFEVRGHVLDAAPDGITGLHLALTQSYDALILDWMLPRMDGPEVLRKLRDEGNSDVPVIMLT